MGRIKGVKMTEEQKAFARERRMARKSGKVFADVCDNLNRLSYAQLNLIKSAVEKLLAGKRQGEIEHLTQEILRVDKALQEIRSQVF